MGFVCAVVGCSHRVGRDGFNFYRLPAVVTRQGDKHQELCTRRRRQWLANINRADITPSRFPNIRVCSDHFITGKPSSLYDDTSPDWAPTQKMGHNKFSQNSVALSSQRAQRLTERKDKVKAAACIVLDNSDGDMEVMVMDSEPSDEPRNVHVQTEMDFNKLHGDLIDARRELTDLRQKVADSACTELSFEGNDNKVKFYTGLPSYNLLMIVFNFVSPYVPVSHRNILTQFQQFILVLMRLRLMAAFQDLAYRFSISVATASRIFDRWIPVMDARLSFLIFWPEREMLQKTMPISFKQSFGNKVAVIVDCFEVFIDRPSSLSARAMTWSNYKHHNTVKFLIGITPQGVISFISKAWGGRASDKFITENCSFINNLAYFLGIWF